MRNILLSFLGSFCPAVLFNIERKNLIWAGFSGTVGWLVYVATERMTGNLIIAAFFGGIAVSFYSEIMARIIKTPAFIFSITGIYPLVPGMRAFNSLYALMQGDYQESVNLGISTIGMACAIAFGLLIVYAGFQAITNTRIYLINKKEHN